VPEKKVKFLNKYGEIARIKNFVKFFFFPFRGKANFGISYLKFGLVNQKL